MRAPIEGVFDRAPFIQLIGYALEDWGEGWVETSLMLQPKHLQQHGYVHAGVLTTMADHTSGGAASTVIPDGYSILTAQLSMHLLRPAQGQALRCRADVVKPGRSLIVTQADVYCDHRHVGRFHATMAAVERSFE